MNSYGWKAADPLRAEYYARVASKRGLKLPSVAEMSDRIRGYLRSFDGDSLADYLNELFFAIEHSSGRALRLKDLSFIVGNAFARAIELCGREEACLQKHLSETSSRLQETTERLDRLQIQGFLIAELLEWDGVIKDLSYVWGNVCKARNHWELAERHYQSAVAYPGPVDISLAALQALGELWRETDLLKAAYFYRWAAEADRAIPAVAYVKLFHCLVAAGQKGQVEAEIHEYKAFQEIALTDLMRLAAAKQALGQRAEADALWDQCLWRRNETPVMPESWVEHIQTARSIGRLEM